MGSGTVRWETAVFLGVQGYGTVKASEKARFRFQFSTDGVEKEYAVTDRNCFAAQNELREGALCRIALCGETVVAVEPPKNVGAGTAADSQTVMLADGRRFAADGVPVERIVYRAGGAEIFSAEMQPGDGVCATVSGGKLCRIYLTERVAAYQPPVRGTPGKRTLKNFLATALEPVGTTLYVYGGGWNWQDDGANAAAVSPGLSPYWTTFFQRQDEDYSYRSDADFSRSWYSHNGWNEYGWAGLDCSGYVGWVVYNLMHDTPGLPGYVQNATGMAQDFARRGWGKWIRDDRTFHPGDIISMSGHVWICLGTCGDGSLVILHSTPSPSKTGALGGGVQISAVGEREDCEAYCLARTYMERFYPAWSARYAAVCRSYADYAVLAGKLRTGKFRWDLYGTICDSDGISGMMAEEILRSLFCEEASRREESGSVRRPGKDNM